MKEFINNATRNLVRNNLPIYNYNNSKVKKYQLIFAIYWPLRCYFLSCFLLFSLIRILPERVKLNQVEFITTSPAV